MRDNVTAWKKLGMNIELHDAVLNIVGTAFGAVYMSQHNRPEKMDYFNEFLAEIHGRRIHELMEAREEGKKVIGTFCVFIPEELTLAAGAIQIGLCSGAELAFDAAEQYIPRNTCSLIKSAFGFNIAKVCPYVEVADLVVGENTCDGKKKAFESYKQLVPHLYILDLPQMKSPSGKALLLKEYESFKEKLESMTGNKITPESLSASIQIVNAKRKALMRLASLRDANPVPISGLDVLLINQIAFLDDPQRFTQAVNELCDELEERIKKGIGAAPAKTPRVLISGCPMAVPNWKLPNLIEKNGGIIVGEETCTGERGVRNIVENESPATIEEGLQSITDRYFKIDCAVFTPNVDRLNHIKEMVANYKADGVIHYSISCCQPYMYEAISYEKQLEADGIPTLCLETDYSQEDMGQLQTRVEAFLERIGK
ncbi:MAG: double-cubane-cluster-containing anaerobic reductase [Bacteroidales bacterium]